MTGIGIDPQKVKTLQKACRFLPAGLALYTKSEIQKAFGGAAPPGAAKIGVFRIHLLMPFYRKLYPDLSFKAHGQGEGHFPAADIALFRCLRECYSAPMDIIPVSQGIAYAIFPFSVYARSHVRLFLLDFCINTIEKHIFMNNYT